MVCNLWFPLQLLDNMVDTRPRRHHCWHHVSLLHVWPQVLLRAGFPNPSHSYHLEAFELTQCSSHPAHTVRSVCVLCKERRRGRVWKSHCLTCCASDRQFGKSLFNCLPFIVFTFLSNYAGLIFTCTLLLLCIFAALSVASHLSWDATKTVIVSSDQFSTD